MTASTTLVLFDIDGTLIHSAGAGVRGMNSAFERLHGKRMALEGVPIAGRTDLAILRDAFAALSLDWTPDAVRALQEAYFAELPDELARSAAGAGTQGEHFGVLPGVENALSAMEASPAHQLALLTGNFTRGAEIKLGYFDLWQRFAFGAFGDDHLDRRDLVPVAIARARAAGGRPERVIIIGDTPLDIDCAHAHGAYALAVATGTYSAADLARAGADLVVDTLETGEWTAAVGLIGALGPAR
jgi:phosphoglycolate phosphatase-like HAD superfamily hydrolase